MSQRFFWPVVVNLQLSCWQPQSYLATPENPDTVTVNVTQRRGLTEILWQPYCRALASWHSLSCWFNKQNSQRVIWRQRWDVAAERRLKESHISCIHLRKLIIPLWSPSVALQLSVMLISNCHALALYSKQSSILPWTDPLSFCLCRVFEWLTFNDLFDLNSKTCLLYVMLGIKKSSLRSREKEDINKTAFMEFFWNRLNSHLTRCHFLL